MDFRTLVHIAASETAIVHSHSILLMGSCFAENMGQKLQNAKFQVDVNPFGVLYNPTSIKKALQRLVEGNIYKETDLFEEQGRWQSFDHHSSFSFSTKEETLLKMNERLSASAEKLKKADYLMLTFGTAWVYRLQESGEIVSNCHKMPAKAFTRSRLTVDEIVEDYSALIKSLRNNNPRLKVILTVSPIRHWKDGANGNNLSKAILLLAVETLNSRLEDVFYFPSYEIVLDELRDYRFFADDMLHPSTQAVDYVWERFSETYFSTETKKLLKEIAKIQQAVAHRPFNREGKEYGRFCELVLNQIATMEKEYLGIDFEREKTTLRLNTI